MSEWQPIETVPKDGRPFLVYWPAGGQGREVDMVGGWAEYSEIIGYGEPPATHWMPLPDPPAANSMRRGQRPPWAYED